MMNVPTFKELKQALQILEVEPEYDRMGRIKLTGNRPVTSTIAELMMQEKRDEKKIRS